MIVNYKSKLIQIKIVYYGCALSGKTTSLKSLFNKFGKNGELTSIETTTGRTLFFDTLQMIGGEWMVKILLYSATGQDFYASTRPATLSGTDGIVFVIDSQKKYFDDNYRSWKELHYYFAENVFKIPIVLSLNKRDLPDIIDISDVINKYELNKFKTTQIIETIALSGKGVTKTFKSIMSLIFPSVIIR
ncbi:MAG: GTP-binding protein [Promethearchaeota archaeon]